MSVQGLDRAQAPSAPVAKRMLGEIGGRWWNVYIGGPKSGGHGWTPALVADYVRHGIDRFMLTYVGRQQEGPLTRAQGQADARDALAIAKTFGYTGNFPLCLDVERSTFDASPVDTVTYTRAWCATVAKEGVRPGVYSNPSPLQAMAKGRVPADFVWIANWVDHNVAKHDPHDVPHLPANLWRKPGARAWQYAAAFDGKPCRVLGVDVDISVADLGCLAEPPAIEHVTDAALAPVERVLRLGDQGREVRRLTQHLSFVRSPVAHRPYLNHARDEFDEETENALKAFQREHHLVSNGKLTKKTQEALRDAVARAKKRRDSARVAEPGHLKERQPAEPARSHLDVLVRRVTVTERAHQAALEGLLAYGLRRQLLMRRLQDVEAASTKGLLTEIVSILQAIQADVEGFADTATDLRAIAAVTTPSANAPALAELSPRTPTASDGTTDESATPDGSETVTMALAGEAKLSSTPDRGSQSGPPLHLDSSLDAEATLDSMTDRAIVSLIRELDQGAHLARGALVERFKRYDRAITLLGVPRTGEGSAEVHIPPGGSGARPKHTAGEQLNADQDVGKGRSPVDIKLGDEAHLVRASKIALARFLAAKGNKEHATLRRELKREARRRKRGEIATRAWEKGVRAAQHLSGFPVTGVMDSQLQKLLQHYWPSDSALRGLLRATPGWRLIKGQLSPNFNLREFACKDGTSYIAGLVREQALSGEQAKRRAHELAKRLERVRTASGDRPLRPTSVYRTIAHNASLSGSATNSAHLRGYAADIPPPAGQSLETHRKHMRAAFEAGVGFYPNSNFVHGDFDMGLGRREWSA